MLPWLAGISAREVGTNVYEIQITGYGPADVGPYADLREHVGQDSGLECHHIVESEHILLLAPPYTHATAPAVAIPASMHRQLISPRITAELGPFGGRWDGKVVPTSGELLELYRNLYTWHTPFRELYRIAEHILR